MDEPYPRQMGSKSNHAAKLQQHLYDQLLAQSEFCDVSLDIGGSEMKAHWSVLVSCPYFQSLYDSGMKERNTGKVKISVGKTVALRAAITFLYTGTIEIAYENVKDILEVADYLQIQDLKQACAEYLSFVEITVDNCISLSLLSSLYDIDIYSKVFDFVRGHLPQVMEQPETLTLTSDSIIVMLTDKSLNYVALEDFFKFIVKWAEHDLEKREEYFEEMFCALDLRKMSREFLEKTVESCPLVSKCNACVMHALNTKMRQMTGLAVGEGGVAQDVILLVGGCGQGQYFHSFLPFFPLSDVISVNNLYGYIISEDRWTELAPLPYQMRKPLVAYDPATNQLYVYDSSSGSPIENDVVFMFKFSILEKSWTSIRLGMPDLCCELTIQNMVWCNGRLYFVASGRFSDECSSHSDWQCCMLQVTEDGSHCEMKTRLFPRTAKTVLSVCCVDDRYICIMGWKCRSRAATKNKKLIRFIYMDTKYNKKWDNSKGALYEPVMFPLNGELCLSKLGGSRYRKFNFGTRKWTSTNDLLLPHPVEEPARSDYIYTTHQDQLYIFGGKSPTTKKQLENSCVYSLSNQTWTELHSLPKSLTNSGVVVAQIPAEHVRCHIDCPHCTFQTVRSQASYQIDYRLEDDDDDEDISYDDEDIYSDYWDDDFYDPVEQYDWY